MSNVVQTAVTNFHNGIVAGRKLILYTITLHLCIASLGLYVLELTTSISNIGIVRATVLATLLYVLTLLLLTKDAEVNDD